MNLQIASSFLQSSHQPTTQDIEYIREGLLNRTDARSGCFKVRGVHFRYERTGLMDSHWLHSGKKPVVGDKSHDHLSNSGHQSSSDGHQIVRTGHKLDVCCRELLPPVHREHYMAGSNHQKLRSARSRCGTRSAREQCDCWSCGQSSSSGLNQSLYAYRRALQV